LSCRGCCDTLCSLCLSLRYCCSCLLPSRCCLLLRRTSFLGTGLRSCLCVTRVKLCLLLLRTA